MGCSARSKIRQENENDAEYEFNERQVLGILKAVETGRTVAEVWRNRGRDLGVDIFQLKVEVWRDDGNGDQALAGA